MLQINIILQKLSRMHHYGLKMNELLYKRVVPHFIQLLLRGDFQQKSNNI